MNSHLCLWLSHLLYSTPALDSYRPLPVSRFSFNLLSPTVRNARWQITLHASHWPIATDASNCTTNYFKMSGYSMHVYVYVCMYVFVCVYLCVCMCLYVCIYVYICICIKETWLCPCFHCFVDKHSSLPGHDAVSNGAPPTPLSSDISCQNSWKFTLFFS